MKWESKKPFIGQRRTVKRFLWFPLNLKTEWRWLETAIIKQQYTSNRMVCNEQKYWNNLEFGEEMYE